MLFDLVILLFLTQVLLINDSLVLFCSECYQRFIVIGGFFHIHDKPQAQSVFNQDLYRYLQVSKIWYNQISQKINVISEVWTLNRLTTDCFSSVQVSVKNPSAEKRNVKYMALVISLQPRDLICNLQSSFSFGVTSIEHDPLADDVDNQNFRQESPRVV